jgi:3-hydroxyisobutyrate dehydrogenase-like beta-hydroxyacid dehydrogenase
MRIVCKERRKEIIQMERIQDEVSVIGLGMMGSRLAQLLLRHGYRVTVWNRTSAKAEPLVRDGAMVAPSAAAAVGASPIVVVCVYDYKAASAILDTEEVASALGGRVLLQLTTGSPKEARDGEAWARQRGAGYLDGAIQAAPSQMARPDTTILVSGAESAFRRSEPLLKVFGGNVKYLGEQIGAASAMDLATLSYVYGALLGFFHGARIAESEGFRVDHYGSLVAEISPTFAEFFRHEGAVIQSGNYLEKAESIPKFRSSSRGSSRRPRPPAMKTRKWPPSSKYCAAGVTETPHETKNLNSRYGANGLRAREGFSQTRVRDKSLESRGVL